MGKNTFVHGASDPYEKRLGSVLADKWTLTRLIGVGGMAAVYDARHQIGRHEAIKILHASVARQEELRKRFEQEAYAVNALAHPGIVEIRDVGTTDDGCPFLVMELLSGASVADRLLDGSLPAESALDLVDALLDVLVATHAAGIIHRDLKPDNLFITTENKLKVLDFGVARVRAAEAQRVVTQTGTAMGTLQYMPPEQLKGTGVDHRADLFAVGAVLWELLTGRDVHPAASRQELIAKMLTTPIPPIGTVAPAIPEPIAKVVDRALAFEASDRYPDALTMLSDLREARAGRPPPFASGLVIDERATVAGTPHALQATATTGKKRDERKALIAIVAAGTLVGALATVLIISAASDDGETTALEADDDRSRRRRSSREEGDAKGRGAPSVPAVEPSGGQPSSPISPSASGRTPPSPQPGPSPKKVSKRGGDTDKEREKKAREKEREQEKREKEREREQEKRERERERDR